VEIRVSLRAVIRGNPRFVECRDPRKSAFR
jgi:hypothetical protein